MKSTSFFILSILLVVAIMAPSIITLVDADSGTELVMDFNEEENNKEEKKETKEKDFFMSFQIDGVLGLKHSASRCSSFYIERKYSFSSPIVLPPPEQIV